MKAIQNVVFGVAINPVDSIGATTDGTAFDTAAQSGMGYAAVVINIGNIAANASAFKLQESDDNSSWSDITGGGFTSPTAAGSDNKVWVAGVQLGGSRKRYLRVTITGGGGGATLVGGSWLGFQVCQSPNSDTERGVAQSLFV